MKFILCTFAISNVGGNAKRASCRLPQPVAFTTINMCAMRKLVKYLFVCLGFLAVSAMAAAQTAKWQDLYKVKKKDTIYGIAKKYDISIDELVKANPEMQKPDYTLKKGDQLLIPYPAASAPKPSAATSAKQQEQAPHVRVGVMLPLHNVDGDGQRMLEYYRGVLMACDSMKAHGISTSVHAWNVPIDANVQQTLADPNAATCNIIFGPLYTKQVPAIGDFCRKHGIKLVIPFSISGNDVASNPQIFQVYQTPASLNEAAIKAFLDRFGGRHPVFVDCNDTTSRKGGFTFALRKKLEARGVKYSITNLRSSDASFAKAFVKNEPNVVILNTGRSPELNATLAKLDILRKSDPGLIVSLYGYTEWLMYTKVYRDYFHKYDAYIPTTFYYNQAASGTIALENAYRRWFKSDMREALPRFAITGYDQARFFVTGLYRFGNNFSGTFQQQPVKPLQTPLKFKRVANGGMQNSAFMLVHFTRNRTVESINY